MNTPLPDALTAGKIAAYATDVLAVEPMPADNPLRLAPNTYSPHILPGQR